MAEYLQIGHKPNGRVTTALFHRCVSGLKVPIKIVAFSGNQGFFTLEFPVLLSARSQIV